MKQRNKQQRMEQKRRYYERYPEKLLEKRQRYLARYPEKAARQYQQLREYRQNNPEKQRLIWAVREKVRTALRNGVLVKPTVCEECGCDDRKITMAHSDYTKPLEVRWLCWPCHCRWDRQQPKLYRRSE